MEAKGYELRIGVDRPHNEQRPGDLEWRRHTEWITVSADDSLRPILELAQAFYAADLPVAVEVKPLGEHSHVSVAERRCMIPLAKVLLRAVLGGLSESGPAEVAEVVRNAYDEVDRKLAIVAERPEA